MENNLCRVRGRISLFTYFNMVVIFVLVVVVGSSVVVSAFEVTEVCVCVVV